MTTHTSLLAPALTALDTERLRREVSRQGLGLTEVFKAAGMPPALARTPYGELVPIACTECERLAEFLGIEAYDISVPGIFGD